MASQEFHPPRIEGRLWLTVSCSDGTVCARRFAANTVMRSGAELIAALISGKITTPINGVAVGIDPTPSSPPYEVAALTLASPDGAPTIIHSAAPVVGTDVGTELRQKELKVRVSISASIPAGRAVHPDSTVDRVMIGEAALGVLAPDGEQLSTIYNRVVFEPVPKTRQHELSLFWELDFPYGI